MKRDVQMVFGESGVTIDWSSAVTGIELMKQKLVNHLLTDIGTDDVVPTRGTTVLRDAVGGGIYDFRSAQHALNFATLASRLAVKAAEPSDLDASERVSDFTAVIDGIRDGQLVTRLTVVAADGTVSEISQPII